MVSLRQFVLVCAFLAVNIAIGSGLERGKCTPTEVDNGYDCGNFNKVDQWGKCRVRGDPHFLTWDGVRYDYNSNCIYTVLGFCDDSVGLKINVDMQPHPTTAGRFRVEVVTITWGGITWIQSGADGIVSFGSETDISAYTEEDTGGDGVLCLVVRIRENGEDRVRVVFYPEFGLLIINLAKPWATSEGKKVCGMCGTPNDNPTDDLKTKSNKPPNGGGGGGRRKRMTANPSKIASAWRVSCTSNP